MSSPKAQLELLRPWQKVSDKDLKKANEDDFFGKLGKNIQSAGKQVFDAGADTTKAFFDAVDKNQIKNLQNRAKANLPGEKSVNPELKKLQQNVKQREIDSAQRTRDLEGDKAASQGKATLITDKPKIFKNIAKKEVKRAKETPAYYNNYVNQAVGAYEKQLRDTKQYSEDDINQFVGQARTMAQQKVNEVGKQDINESKNLVNSLANDGGESVGGFNVERANIGFDQAEGKNVGLARQIKASPILETGVRIAKPIVQTVNNVGGLIQSAEDQTIGRGINLLTGRGFKAGDIAQKQLKAEQQLKNALPSVGGENIADAVDVEQNLGTAGQQFLGQTLPYLVAPETALAKGGGALAARQVGRGLLRKVVGAGVKEGLADTPLSVAQTLGDLNTQVLEGKMTYEQALQQAPSAIAMNAVGDFVGAGALKGAGDLVGKGLKNLNVPKAPQTPQTPVNQALPETPVAQAITPQQIRQNAYQTSVQKLGEISKRNKTLTQELKQAELTGDYATAAKLKLEAKYIKTQTKFLKQTVNNLELKGLQEQAQVLTNQVIPETPTAQALPSNSGLSQTAQDVARILGEEPNNQLPLDTPRTTNPTVSTKGNTTTNTPQKTVSGANQVLSELPPNKSASVSALPNTKALPEAQVKTEISSALEPELKASETPRIESESVKSSNNQGELPPNKSLGQKVLNENQGKAGIRRTIYNAKDFQEAARNPAKLRTLSENYKDVLPRNAEKIINEASEIKAKSNDIKASLDDNKAQLQKLFDRAKVNEITIEIAGKPYTIKKPSGGEEVVVLNRRGEQSLEAIAKKYQEEGKLTYDADKGVNLAIQTQSQGASKATKYGTKTLEDAAKEHIQFLREAAVLSEKESFLKEKIMSDIAPKLEDGGLDHVFRNEKADTSFTIRRNQAKQQFASPEIEAQFKAEKTAQKAQLMSQPENVKLDKKAYGSAGVSEAQALGVNKRSKAGKAEYDEFQSKIRRDLEAKTALEDGKIDSPKQAEAVIEKAKTDLKGMQFGFASIPVAKISAPIIKMAVANLDLAVGAIGLYKSFGEILPSLVNVKVENRQLKFNAKEPGIATRIAKTLGEIVDFQLGTTRSVRSQLKSSKNPKVNEFMTKYDEMVNGLAVAKNLLAHKLTDADRVSIAKLYKEYSAKELKEMIDSGKPIEGIDDIEKLKILQSFNSASLKRQKFLQDTLRSQDFKGNDKLNIESLLAAEEKIRANNFLSSVLDAGNSLAMKTALMSRASSSLLALTDPLMKGSLQGLNPKRITKASFEVLTPEIRNSNLFKTFQAGKFGTYLDETVSALDKVDMFKASTQLAQDVGLLASARKFNDDWFKKTGQKIDIVKDFDGLSPSSLEFSMSWNKLANEMYGIGEGFLDSAPLQNVPQIKGFMALTGEVFRLTAMQTKALKGISDGIKLGIKTKNPKAGWDAVFQSAAPLLGFLVTGTLLGGSAFLSGAGPIGLIYNNILNNIDPEDRERVIDTFNQASLAHFLNLNIGEKLRLNAIDTRSEESIKEGIKQALKGEAPVQNFVLEMLGKYPKTVQKAFKQFEAGNGIEGAYTLASGVPFLSGLSPIFKTIQKKNTGESASVWVEEKHAGKAKFLEYKKPAEWADIFGETLKARDLKRKYQLRDEAIKFASDFEIRKIGKGEKAKYQFVNGDEEKKKRFEKLVKVMSEERYQIPGAKNTQQDIANEILEVIDRKNKAKEKSEGKFANQYSADYMKTLSKDKLVNNYANLSGDARNKAIMQMEMAKQEAKGREKSKYAEAIRRLNQGELET